jgi:hypothetical protein
MPKNNAGVAKMQTNVGIDYHEPSNSKQALEVLNVIEIKLENPASLTLAKRRIQET